MQGMHCGTEELQRQEWALKVGKQSFAFDVAAAVLVLLAALLAALAAAAPAPVIEARFLVADQGLLSGLLALGSQAWKEGQWR